MVLIQPLALRTRFSDVRATMEDDVLGSNATPVAGDTSLVVLVLVLLMHLPGENFRANNLGVAQRSDDLFEAMSDTQEFMFRLRL